MILVTASVLFLILCLCIQHIGIRPADGENWLSHEKTSYLNSFFITAVFFSHLRQYELELSPVESTAYPLLIPGQLIVTTFFFFSGYGLMSGLLKKGDSYVSSIARTRFPKLLLHFCIAVVLYVLAGFMLGHTYPVERILLSLIGWDSVGNSNWFIFMTLLCYLLMWAAFKLTSTRRVVTGTLLFTILLVAAIACIQCVKAGYWVDTVLCMPAGMLFYLCKEKARNILMARFLPHLPIGALAAASGYILYTHAPAAQFYLHCPALVAAIAGSILFATGIALMYGCITFRHLPKPLVWVGGAGLFPLYIFQRIPMMTGAHYGLNTYSPTLYTIICMIATAILAIAASRLFRKLDSLLFTANRK